MTELLGRLRWLKPDGPGLSDARLLDQFVRRHDGSAFAALVRRHGAMVLTVCRRILRDAHEAEDAFQATFLVLARRAGSLSGARPLAPWLYGVALRTARALRRRSRRRREEPLSIDPPAPSAPEFTFELREQLDGALRALPAKYRAPVVLCHLQGLSRRQAAEQIGCPEGTLSAHLARALVKLRQALAGPGRELSAGALVAALAAEQSAAVPTGLAAAAAVRVAVASLTHPLAAAATPAVVALTQGVLRMDSLRRLAPAGLALLLTLGLGAGALVRSTATAADDPPTPFPKESPLPRQQIIVRLSSFRDVPIRRHWRVGGGLEFRWPIVVRDGIDEVGLRTAVALERHMKRLRREPGCPTEVVLEKEKAVPPAQVTAANEACRAAGFSQIEIRATAAVDVPASIRRVIDAGSAEKFNRLRGEWRIVEVQQDGDAYNPFLTHSGVQVSDFFTFQGGSIKDARAWEFAVDPTKSPAQIEFLNGGGPRDAQDYWTRGIYRLNGDEWTIAYYDERERSAKRPTDFGPPTPGSHLVVVRLRLFTRNVSTGIPTPPPHPRQIQLDLALKRGDPHGSREKGSIHLIAEPKLVTYEGQATRFFAGGELSDEVARSLRLPPRIGTNVEIIPSVLANGDVRLDVTFDDTAVMANISERTEALSNWAHRAETVQPGKTVTVVLRSAKTGQSLWLVITPRVIGP